MSAGGNRKLAGKNCERFRGGIMIERGKSLGKDRVQCRPDVSDGYS